MTMDIIETFGRTLQDLSETNPGRARRVLKIGWQAQNLRLKLLPDKRLQPADRYLTRLMMETMLKLLQRPEDSVIVSIFTPCELIQEAGLHPYNVEGFSAYLNGSGAEQRFLRQAEESGLSETLCSYHKAFIGAACNDLLPKPRCIVYTNLTCDANLLTFRYLADRYQVPCFFLDVPFQPCEENVRYVADQFRQLKDFLEECTGRNISEEHLSERIARSSRTLENYEMYQKERAGKYVPSDLVTPMYAAMANNILLGTEEEETYTRMLLKDIKQAGPAKGIPLYWMHTIPFWSESLKKQLHFQERVRIVGCELAQVFDGTLDPGKPFEAMARRLVYHSMNGEGSRRIENGIRCAKEAGARGAVWFNHWGCKHTMGNARLAKEKFEAAGIPLLILDNDGCDRSHGGEGQLATRLEAFLEMLEENGCDASERRDS